MTPNRLFYTRSTNGGASWSAPAQVRDYNLTGFSGSHCPDAQDNRCIGPFGAIDVDNTGGACDDAGCTGGAPSCTASCTLDFSACTGCNVCDNSFNCKNNDRCQ